MYIVICETVLHCTKILQKGPIPQRKKRDAVLFSRRAVMSDVSDAGGPSGFSNPMYFYTQDHSCYSKNLRCLSRACAIYKMLLYTFIRSTFTCISLDQNEICIVSCIMWCTSPTGSHLPFCAVRDEVRTWRCLLNRQTGRPNRTRYNHT